MNETDVIGIFKLPMLFSVMSQYSIIIGLYVPIPVEFLAHDNYHCFIATS